MKSFSNFIQEARTADEISADARQANLERQADAKKRLRAKRDAIKANTTSRLGAGGSHNEETVLEYAGQAITNTTQGGSSGTRDDMETKKPQPSLLAKIRGKQNAKKASNNVAKQAGQSVKNATDNTAGTGSQRKPQPYRQTNKSASAKPEKGGAITKTDDNKSSTIAAKKPIAQPVQKAKVKVHSGRPQVGSAQRPDLAGAKPTPMIAGAPQPKQLSPSSAQKLPANAQRKALPQARS
tara:strand:- start:4004 stop:4720 length:717 start_codon:yes stop_codon:yes gene_type:complete